MRFGMLDGCWVRTMVWRDCAMVGCDGAVVRWDDAMVRCDGKMGTVRWCDGGDGMAR